MSQGFSVSAPRLVLALVTAAIALLAATPSAFAGTLSSPTGSGFIEFLADSGEANKVTVAVTPNSLTISDSEDTIETTIVGCSGSGSSTVTCSGLDLEFMSITLDGFSVDPNNDTLALSGSVNVSVNGGEGNDTLTSTGTGRFEARGDKGNDTVTGGSGNDSLSGDEGIDTVNGNAGHDSVQGGEEADVVGAGTGNDLFIAVAGDGSGDVQNGGPGFDQALYIGETEGTPPNYVINLAAGTASGGGETDTLVNVEDLTTFQGEDTVTGTAGANSIITALDEETLLVALSGITELDTDAGDSVNPLGGPDFVKTGASTDFLNLVDGTPDRADCGAGVDFVQADQADELINCENVTLAAAATAAGTAAAGAATAGTAADSAKPNCTLKGVARSYSRKAFLKGPKPSVGCDEQVTLEAQLTTPLPRDGKGRGAAKSGGASSSAAGDLILAEKSSALAGSHTLRLKPLARLASRLGGSFKATIRIVARDRAGNATVLQRAVKVKPDAPKKRG